MIGKVIRTDVGDIVTATSLPALPDPKSIKDEASASDALCSTLAVVATGNRKLATVPREDQPDGLLEDLATFHEHLNGLFKELHELLPKIASLPGRHHRVVSYRWHVEHPDCELHEQACSGWLRFQNSGIRHQRLLLT
jgi:hypothetical protein